MAKSKLTPEEKEQVKGHRLRMKQEFLAGGLTGWPEHHILELILFFSIPQGDVKPLARELIYRFGSFSRVLDAPFEALVAVPGVGENTATLLKLFPETGAAYAGNRARASLTITNAQEAFQVLAPYFFGVKHEQVYILCLDGKKQLLGARLVSEGSILATNINLRRIVEEAMTLRAISLYLAHNHVASDLDPSPEDWEVTQVVINSLFNIGLYLEDHLVIANDRMLSLRALEGGQRKRLNW